MNAQQKQELLAKIQELYEYMTLVLDAALPQDKDLQRWSMNFTDTARHLQNAHHAIYHAACKVEEIVAA